jgi:hypothetical protein
MKVVDMIELRTNEGDIIATTTPFDTFITVNTIELATELLEKHASVSSNRPSNVMIQDLSVICKFSIVARSF